MKDIDVYQNLLLVAGDYERIGSTNVSGIAAIDLYTGEVITFGSGVSGSNARVESVEIFNDQIYIGGFFNGVSGIDALNFARYDGESWSVMGAFDGTVYDIENAGDEKLYVGGFFSEIDTVLVEHVAVWNGSAWSPLGQGITTFNVQVYDMDFANGLLYVGGQFDQVTQSDGTDLTANHLAKWNGTSWEAFEGFAPNDYIYEVNYDTDGGVLYIGGDFNDLGIIPANSVARYSTGTGWGGFGDGITVKNGSASVPLVKATLRSGQYLYVGGFFRAAGDRQANAFTRYALENGSFDTAVSVDLGEDITKCADDVAVLKPEGDYLRAVWSTGEEADSIEVTEAGEYWVEVFNDFGCSALDTIVVENLSSLVDIGNDTTFCEGDSVVLDAGPGFSSYLWSTGSEAQSITVTEAGLYYVTVTDTTGCEASDSVNVDVIDKPVIDLGSDIILCEGDTAVLDAGTGYASYEWNTGETDPAIEVTDGGTYYVTVANSEGCLTTDSIQVTIESLPVIDLGQDTLICPGEEIQLDAGEGFASYSWNTGATSQQITVTETGTYVVEATTTGGCTVTDSIEVNYHESGECQEAPVVNNEISDQEISAGIDYSFTIPDNTFTDPNGDPLTITVNLPEGSFLSYDQETSTISGLPAEADTGSYTIDVVATDPADSQATESYVLTVIPPAGLTVNLVPSDGGFCEDEAIDFDVQVTDAPEEPEIEWLVNGENVAINDINLEEGDVVEAKASLIDPAEERLMIGYSDEVTVQIFNNPDTSLTSQGFIVTAPAGAEYTWYVDGDTLPDTTRSIIAKQLGTYQARVTSDQGCTVMTEEHPMFVTGMDETEEELLRVYPNPVRHRLRIRVDRSIEKGKLKINDISGRLIISREFRIPEMELDVSGWNEGYYLIRIKSDDQLINKKIYKTR